MAASAVEILEYLTDIKFAQSSYQDKVVRLEKIGNQGIFKYKLRSTILGFYTEMLVNYFSQDNGNGEYATNNFMTITEAQSVINRINRICDSNYIIAL